MPRSPSRRASPDRARASSPDLQPAEPIGCRPLKKLSRPGFFVAEMRDVSTALRWAAAYLGCARHLVHNPCVVLDIDGTVLFHQERKAVCVLGFRAFAAACARHGILLYVVTARPETPGNREWTEGQLAKCGIEPVERLYMRPPEAEVGSTKFAAREEIRKQASITLSIGDQFTDLSAEAPPRGLRGDRTYVGTLGDGGGMGIKLPDE